MTTGLTYATYKTQIATMTVVDETDAAFNTILPMAITYAENRIYREVDFLFTSTTNTNYSVNSGSRTISIPPGTNFADPSFYGGGVLVVAEQINLITPAGSTNPDTATRVPLLPTTKEFLDAVYGQSSSTGQPKYFCPFDDYTFLVGPFADATYRVEIIGTFRPASLSSTNTTTFISLYLPELFVMASMVYVSAYQRNFSSAQGNDPGMPITYETQYQALLKSAMSEENRKKFEAAAWSSQGASTSATPTRG